jgi:hypothetical protein
LKFLAQGGAKPRFKLRTKYFSNHRERSSTAKEAVVATPERSAMAKGFLQPIRFDQGKTIDFTEEFGSSLGEALPDRLIAVL